MCGSISHSFNKKMCIGVYYAESILVRTDKIDFFSAVVAVVMSISILESQHVD